MLRTLFRLEALLLFRSPVALALIALVALVSAGALAVGAAELRQTQAANAAYLADATAKETKFRDMLVDIEGGAQLSPFAGKPMAISRAFALDDGVLGDFAAGAGDLYPNRVKVRLFETSVSLFENYQFDNPTMLQLSGFDMTAVVVLLMPLLMIGLCFDALSAERQTGLLKLTLLSGVDEGRFLTVRLAVRCGALWAALTAVTLLAAILNPGGADLSQRLLHYAAWQGAALAYGAVWGLLLALVIRRTVNVGQSIGSLVGLWIGLVLVVPALTTAAVQALYPTPSRLAYLSEARAAAAGMGEEADILAGIKRNDPRYQGQTFPESAPFRKDYLRHVQVEDATRDKREAFDVTLERRDTALTVAQGLSPAIAADTLLSTLAGADARRYLTFQAEARAMLARLADRLEVEILTGKGLSVAEYDTLPSLPPARTPLEGRREDLWVSALLLGVSAALIWLLNQFVALRPYRKS